jgi:hypothetical protein
MRGLTLHKQAVKAKADKLKSKVVDLRWFPDLSDEELKIVIQSINPKTDVERRIQMKLNSTYVWRTSHSAFV